MVLGRGRRHLLDNGRDVTKDRGIQQGCGRTSVGRMLSQELNKRNLQPIPRIGQ